MKHNSFEYLSMICKYLNKNGGYVRDSMTVLATRGQNFMQLVESSHISSEWLTLLFSLAIQSKVNFDQDVLNQALKHCNNGANVHLKQYVKQIQAQLELELKS